VDEVAYAWKIPAKYAGYAAPTPVRLLQNVQVVFDEVGRYPLGASLEERILRPSERLPP
jgi:hypothetical protein